MRDSHFDQYRAFDYAQHDPNTASLGSIALGAFIGAYVLLKTLELLGYPVWLWVAQAADMASGILRLRRSGEQLAMPNSGSLISNVFGLSRGGLFQKDSNMPPGLGNWDNSCYQNSVIQGLASLPSLHRYLSHTTAEHNSLDTDTTNGALLELINKLNNPENHGQYFWIRGKLKSMSTFQQQDAQEYYSKILDALEREVKDASSSKRRSTTSLLEATKSLDDASGPADEEAVEEETNETEKPRKQPKSCPSPLDGLLAQRVGCRNCGYTEGLSLIPFNCVTVSLGTARAYDIGDCLDEYTQLEEIDGVECAKCTLLLKRDKLAPLASNKPGSIFETQLQQIQEALDNDDFDDKTVVKKFNTPKNCWVKSTKTKQVVVARPPKSLVLHVNRSIFDERTGGMYKNMAGVAYPKILNMSYWCLGGQSGESDNAEEAKEKWTTEPNRSMLARSEEEYSAMPPLNYQLRAAITHFGTHGNGHYICFRQHPSSLNPTSLDLDGTAGDKQKWWRFSDENVYSVSEDVVASQGNVFMLFYERVDDITSSELADKEPSNELIPIASDAPLPPADVVRSTEVEGSGLDMPLPCDSEDDVDLLSPPASPTVGSSPTASPPPVADEPVPDTSIESVNADAYPTPPPDMQKTTSTQRSASTDPSITQPENRETVDTQSVPPILTSSAEPENPLPASSDDAPTPATSSTSKKSSKTPKMMRTAGDSSSRGQGRSQKMPTLVSAT